MDDNTIRNINLNKFNLPVIIENDRDYFNSLKILLNNYIGYIKNINGFCINSIKSTEQNVDLLIKSLEYYYNADIYKAKKNILDLLSKYVDNKFIVSNLNENYAFRGIAPFKDLYDENYAYDQMNETPLSFFKSRIGDSKFSRKDMLHIPFSKRELVKTQRFSIPGVPCLYLGTTSYVCWLEMDKPQDNIFNVSSYKIKKELRILNLVLDQMLINGHATQVISCDSNKKINNLNMLKTMIEIFPLICATSFRVKNIYREFKSEYIISQLVMQCIEELDIDGIAYTSKKVSHSLLSYPQCVNLALPIKCGSKLEINSESDEYGEICKEIHLTQPVNLSEYLKIDRPNMFIKELSYLNCCFNDGFTSNIELANRNISYQDTIFSRFDNYIYSLEHKCAEIFK
ncbi:RES domain-containing protein [Clostridioides sp. ES-S-0001-02]|uniref:RES domain-containing protein n=1 Tax=Clostridioides sp. ES-S-0001-02 TaxID=2770770 RepID=UPI001D119F84|nr:RES domain-containing protein [Clostridioides sp. ES-S-0001-02]